MINACQFVLPSFKSSIFIDEQFMITFINKRLSIRLISVELNTSARELGTLNKLILSIVLKREKKKFSYITLSSCPLRSNRRRDTSLNSQYLPTFD